MDSELQPLIMDICNGWLPKEAVELIGDSDLIGLAKPDNGIRPIALLEVLRNLAGAMVLKQTQQTLKEALFPKQLFVAVSGGTEIVIHATRAIFERMPNWILLQVDFENMFNELSREGALDAVMRHAPEALPFVRAFYARDAIISLRVSREEMIGLFCMSSQGVFQGDVIAGAVACCLLLDYQNELQAYVEEHSEEIR